MDYCKIIWGFTFVSSLALAMIFLTGSLVALHACSNFAL